MGPTSGELFISCLSIDSTQLFALEFWALPPNFSPSLKGGPRLLNSKSPRHLAGPESRTYSAFLKITRPLGSSHRRIYALSPMSRCV
ncbi:hypothetical protein H6P81_002058 [Aristolochia fimbriata]|uniref:Uncharacterized protein n=1 Tax=Aristolochia fimbriata TaxID=158543 RepID=A0AAV7F8P3_ARIFI|nr:hypothetical protein H6P81_002058 [Aristolochia fimbriata]